MRSGPAPDPNALRRSRDAHEWLRLPAGGRVGEPPPWPLPRATRRELALWAEAWARPQAVAWEAGGQQLEVAIYVRTMRQVERLAKNSALLRVLHAQMDALGLTVAGMRSNRWLLDEGEAQAPAMQAAAAAPTSARARLHLVGEQEEATP